MTDRRFDLAGRVAIVTGASSGLGRHLAGVLADAGARVVAVARRAERLHALAAEHERIEAEPCDVTDEAACTALVHRCLADHGRVDVLVNNAGTSVQEPSELTSMDAFRRVLDLNVSAQFMLTQLVARPMLAGDGGTIINMASVLGLVASTSIPQAAYCASKGALISLTRHLAVEWADRGVRVNAIAPGWFETELTRELFSDERGRRWLERNTPLGRGGAIDELDGTVLLLAGDAGSFITGQVLTVDGGWTAR